MSIHWAVKSACSRPRKKAPSVQTEIQTKQAMDRMYRWTRHVYDASRKYYLLGRDTLIARLNPAPGTYICEIGCGTARNLRKLVPRYPHAYFYGIDASEEMLKTAGKILENYGLSGKVTIAQGFAQSFDPQKTFGLQKPFDTFIFSYALSIIPPWRESLDHALALLPAGGEIHIVDFGGQEELPENFRKFLFWWLDKFHVYHKPEILEHLKKLSADCKGTLTYQPLFRGYAYYAVFKKT
jgi:S-adenosylmethionine-diacylgycerolhomoserine-N-methlytransferase